MSEIRKHRTFAKRIMIWILIFAFLALLSFGVWLYFDSEELFFNEDIFFYFFAGFVFIALVGAHNQIHNVKCCVCGGKTKTIKNTKEDMWQAYCESCNITWSLGIGTNAD